jgi:hypothetical protein
MSAPLQAITPNSHANLLNLYIQIANKMGFEKKYLVTRLSDHKSRQISIAARCYEATTNKDRNRLRFNML